MTNKLLQSLNVTIIVIAISITACSKSDQTSEDKVVAIEIEKGSTELSSENGQPESEAAAPESEAAAPESEAAAPESETPGLLLETKKPKPKPAAAKPNVIPAPSAERNIEIFDKLVDLLTSKKRDSYSPSIIDQIEKSLPWGKATLSAPTSAVVGESKVVILLVTAEKDELSIKEQEVEKDGEIESTSKTKVSNRMKAVLSGTGFQIKSLKEEIQTVSYINTTSWKWSIKAIEKGEQSIFLNLYALLDIGKDTPHDLLTLEKVIKVDVEYNPSKSIKEFIANNWQWLWSTLLVPIVVFLYRRHKKVKEFKNERIL